jgi:hypothetical protein
MSQVMIGMGLGWVVLMLSLEAHRQRPLGWAGAVVAAGLLTVILLGVGAVQTLARLP